MHRHIAFTIISLTEGNCSSTLSNKIIGSLVGRNCILLCKITIYTSLTVFLLMWLTRICDMDSETLTGYIKQGIFALILTEIVIIVSVISTYHTVWKVIFLSIRRQGEINCAYHHFNFFTRENQSLYICNNESDCACLKY